MEALSGSCSGACCARFYLSYSKEILNRHAQQGVSHNGTVAETRTIAEMVVPLDGGRCIGTYNKPGKKPERKFAFTCRHFIGGRCSIYHRRPVVCRQHPADGDASNPAGGCSLDKDNKCTLKAGMPFDQALAEFKAAR